MASPTELTKENLVEILARISEVINDQKDALSKLDTEIGDGDHGFSMAIGFSSVAEKLAEFSQSTIGVLLKKTGFELIKSIGGAAGAVFGTLFTGQASYYDKNLSDKDSLSPSDISLMFTEALNQIKRRGGAEVGDKTMLDALEPAVISLQESSQLGLTLSECFRIAAIQAREGSERTRKMIAKHGRSKNLGARAIGYLDPGSVSTAIIFETIADYLEDLDN
jgi:dihydroxyacetone kinase-like protein